MANPNPSPTTRFQKGQAPSGGRPRGTRDALSQDFLRHLGEDFAAHGKAVIQAVRQERPADYLRVVASLQPKEVEIKTPESALSDEQVEQLYHEMLLRMAGKETKRDQIWQ